MMGLSLTGTSRCGRRPMGDVAEEAIVLTEGMVAAGLISVRGVGRDLGALTSCSGDVVVQGQGF
jgi:hypothetical protein